MTHIKSFIILLLFPLALFAKDPSICLNMIVKNEKDAIIRCLDSVKPFIDYWVIVDTGSTDGTQDIIKNHMKGIPGELHERTWVDFSTNRNQALELARSKADYFLFLDADETLEVAPSFKKHSLDRDLYVAFSHQIAGKFSRVLLAKTSVNSYWQGVLHELYQSTEVKTHMTLYDVAINSKWEDGCRSKLPNKYLEDAKILEKDMQKNPNDPRSMFYLAQCYNAAGEFQKALDCYQKRTTLEGELDEVFYSQFQVGKLQRILKMDPDLFVSSLSKAFLIRPTRVEPLYEIAHYYLETDQDILAYIVAEFANEVIAQNHHANNPVTIHLHNWIYDWGMDLLLGDAAARLGKEDVSMQAYQKVLAQKGIPGDLVDHLNKVVSR